MGMHHTIDLELNRNFTLLKPEWDIIALERVQEACDITKQADVAAVVLQEGNSCHDLFFFTPSRYDLFNYFCRAG